MFGGPVWRPASNLCDNIRYKSRGNPRNGTKSIGLASQRSNVASCRRSLMSLQERLRTIAEALPEGASITLSSEALRSLLETDAEEGTLPHDLTAEEVADLLDRSPHRATRTQSAPRFDCRCRPKVPS